MLARGNANQLLLSRRTSTPATTYARMGSTRMVYGALGSRPAGVPPRAMATIRFRGNRLWGFPPVEPRSSCGRTNSSDSSKYGYLGYSVTLAKASALSQQTSRAANAKSDTDCLTTGGTCIVVLALWIKCIHAQLDHLTPQLDHHENEFVLVYHLMVRGGDTCDFPLRCEHVCFPSDDVLARSSW